MDNLLLAEKRARRGKRWQYGVQVFDRNPEANILSLHDMLKNKTYRTSPYKTFKIHDPKERVVYCLPYFPDRIAHHAIMNVMKPIFNSVFTADTYSCIEGKGIHAMLHSIQDSLKDISGTQYCLKLDVKKFYPSINHDILKQLIRRKIKDRDLLQLLDEIIDSAEGVPIGNFLSQYFANFYLSYFDHWLKEVKQVKNYFRYADDLVILSDNKPYLHQLLADIREYLDTNLKLTIKENYQIFPVKSRGIDCIGYVFFHTHILARKRIKKEFIRMMAHRRNKASIASYGGWFKHCDGKHLLKKYLHDKVQ